LVVYFVEHFGELVGGVIVAYCSLFWLVVDVNWVLVFVVGGVDGFVVLGLFVLGRCRCR